MLFTCILQVHPLVPSRRCRESLTLCQRCQTKVLFHSRAISVWYFPSCPTLTVVSSDKAPSVCIVTGCLLLVSETCPVITCRRRSNADISSFNSHRFYNGNCALSLIKLVLCQLTVLPYRQAARSYFQRCAGFSLVHICVTAL